MGLGDFAGIRDGSVSFTVSERIDRLVRWSLCEVRFDGKPSPYAVVSTRVFSSLFFSIQGRCYILRPGRWLMAGGFASRTTATWGQCRRTGIAIGEGLLGLSSASLRGWMSTR